MELQKALKERRTLHKYEKKIVSKNIIYKAINAANLAPCHFKTFPWRFTIIGKSKRKQIAELVITESQVLDSEKNDFRNKTHDKFLSPSHLLIFSQIKNGNEINKKEDYAACACAFQNLSLSLIEDNVYSKWSTHKIIYNKSLYQICCIDSLKEEIIGLIYIGYGNLFPAINRPSINDVLREI